MIATPSPGSGLRPRQGVFVAVVGPSGAGKDTLIDYARDNLGARAERVHFVRRVVTRPADEASEDHDTMTPEAFARAAAEGAFALSWQAHGLSYGLPANVDRRIEDGHVVIANLSRTALAALRERYRNVVVVLITASPATLAERLAARGRESGDEILKRLSREAECDTTGITETIVNDGTMEAAGEALLGVVGAALERATHSQQ
ncbi:phosphonate metabolism protein/1,5-bisphosphokinase (PRPP-forming) PhnN [Mesorhizobium xinjiangense]|uniref:phosphonate metabolism protein/1,5-bisphosphokinase (PRPP-forming) PhnN n=1 Tax=Mesorhizobium xinjiangense TaxID=2678685 RepID=UPI001F15AC14|nr:phosphonate metabolism protein/1,5-bisphosphokinase (PRPP-forming) PhnN [Mesorhizobium xinjiangense]